MDEAYRFMDSTAFIHVGWVSLFMTCVTHVSVARYDFVCH